MFAKTIIDSDAFLDMPPSTQAMYFHLAMRADDDGFINNPKSIMRIVGAKDDDIKLLIAKKFIIPFESGVVVIKHWRIHNYIQNDRYTETKYIDEKKQLIINEKNGYSLKEIGLLDDENDNVYTLDTQVRLGKVSIGKDSIELEREKTPRFIKPTVDEIKEYVKEKYDVDAELFAEKFYNFYESKGWVVGKSPMKDWKAAVRTWAVKDNMSAKRNIDNLKEVGGNNKKTKKSTLDDLDETEVWAALRTLGDSPVSEELDEKDAWEEFKKL